MEYLYRENPGIARGQGWSALSRNSIGQSCSTMFNQDWFPANNPDFGQNHNFLASNRSVNSVNNLQISKLSNSLLAANSKVDTRSWSPAVVSQQNYFDDSSSSQSNFYSTVGSTKNLGEYREIDAPSAPMVPPTLFSPQQTMAGNSNFLRRSVREDGDKNKGARKKIKPKMFNFGW